MKFPTFTLLCFSCLHSAMAMRTRVRVCKDSWDFKSGFDVSANVDITKSPATITVTEDDIDSDGKAINLAGLIALLQEILALRPSSVPVSRYIFMQIDVEGEYVCITDIEKIILDKNLKCLKVIWNTTATFMASKDDNHINYIMDIGDGGKVVGVTGAENGEMSAGPDLIGITEFQANSFDTSVKDIHSRLFQAKEVYLGGPCFQIVEHTLLNWTALTNVKYKNDGLVEGLSGKATQRSKYWLKEVGKDEALCQGTLVYNSNGIMEFHITDHPEPGLVVQKIRNIVQDFSTGKILLRYKSRLCLSVLGKKPTEKGGIDMPDRLLFGVTKVEVVSKSKSVVIIFDWLQTDNGSSFVHAIKMPWAGDTVFLKASLYFDQGKLSGVAVVQENNQCKANRKDYLQKVHGILLPQVESGACTVEASGPLTVADVDYNGMYKTPLSLKIAKITAVEEYSFEIHFTEE